MDGAPLVIQIKGFDKVMGNLRNLYERAPEQFGQALMEDMGDAMIESNGECPYDQNNAHEDGTPHLRDTGKVEGPINTGDGVMVILSYDTPYAAIQHEVPEYRHDWPEKWKYLEDPVNRHIPRLAPNLVKRMELILQGNSERMNFSSDYRIRQDYRAAQSAFAAGQLAKYGHLLGRFV